jgi:hypothetical protein
MLPHLKQVQVLKLNEYKFIIYISLAIHFRKDVVFDWLFIINTTFFLK